MGWANDGHGLVFRSNELKLYYSGSHTWAMKLSQLPKQKGVVRIITRGLPDINYVLEQLKRRPTDIWIICHPSAVQEAKKIKQHFPAIKVATANVNAKVLLIEPDTVYISSADFGRDSSKPHETEIGVRSQIAHDTYVNDVFTPLWEKAKEIL